MSSYNFLVCPRRGSSADAPAVPWLVEGVGAALAGVRLTNRDALTAAVDWAAGRAAVLSLGADAAVQLTVVTECLAAEELLSLATPCPMHPPPSGPARRVCSPP